MRNTLMILGFAALSAIATAGWMRQPSQIRPVDTANGFGAPIVASAPVSSEVYTAPAPRTPVAHYRTVSEESRPPQFGTRTSGTQIGKNDSYREQPVIQGERSKGKSIAIIAGSTAVGAAVGGIAGHGKGAAIGALSGAALGTVYDRMTHRNTDGYGWKR